MPTYLRCPNDFPLTSFEVAGLWKATCKQQEFVDDQVNIECVSEDEIRKLNEQYRDTPGSTNVLTFSYPPLQTESPGEHDISMCLAVAKRESQQRSLSLRDYVALLLVHAFLHATGLDHEESGEAAAHMRAAEAAILQSSGFKSISLEEGD